MTYMLAKGQDMEDVAALFRALDTDGDGGISQAEFESGLPKFAALIGGEPTPAPEKPIVYDINLWGRKVFSQFDANKDGRMSMKELARGLKALPKTKPVSAPKGTKFMSVEELIAAMDKDGNGYLDLHEWLTMLAGCAGLECAISEAVDETGTLVNYRSLEQQQEPTLAVSPAEASPQALTLVPNGRRNESRRSPPSRPRRL